MWQVYVLDTTLFSVPDGLAAAQLVATARDPAIVGLGIAFHSEDRVRETLQCLAANNLSLCSVRFSLDVRNPESTTQVASCLAELSDPSIILELELHSDSAHDKPSSPRPIPAAADLVSAVATIAAATGNPIALSHRRGRWLATIEDAVRLGMRVNRPNVGVAFNHGQWASDPSNTLREAMQLAIYKLLAVTVDPTAGAGITDLFALLKRHGYEGPIGLASASVGDDPQTRLRGVLAAWRSQRL